MGIRHQYEWLPEFLYVKRREDVSFPSELKQLRCRTNYYTLTRRGRREIEARREWKPQYVDLEG